MVMSKLKRQISGKKELKTVVNLCHKNVQFWWFFNVTRDPKWSTNPIVVMGFVMLFLYYCYGPHYGNGSSTYRGARSHSFQGFNLMKHFSHDIFHTNFLIIKVVYLFFLGIRWSKIWKLPWCPTISSLKEGWRCQSTTWTRTNRALTGCSK